MQFTCVNWQFTHRQRLSLHSRSLESYKADYMCKCGWIDIVSAIEVYMCKLPVYTCKLAVYMQFTCVNQQFTHRQRLSLHSGSLESYKADYMCKCGWIDIASAIEVYMCKLAVYMQFTCVNQQFTHRQRLSLHSRSLESYKADYMCKCGWIDIVSAIEVYMCKLAVYMCKLAVYMQFTCVNQQFTHRQRLSLHSRSLESYKADYMCKCGWIDIASAIEVYMCKLAVYMQFTCVNH